MEFYLSALDITVQQSVLLFSTPTLRDTVNVSLFLHQLNTLFFFRNGNYHIRYNNFMLALLNAAKVLTETSNVALDLDAVTYLAGGVPLTDFVNVDAWIANFDTVFANKITYLNSLLQSFDCENGTDAELNGSAFKHFLTTNPKNVAYTVATAASWTPPDGWDGDTSYPIVFPPSTSLYFFAGCRFSPMSVVPIRYKISIAFYCVVYKNGDDKNVPVDTTLYEVGDTVTVLGQGNMVNPSGLLFLGWSKYIELSNPMNVTSTFAFEEDVTLYAVWGAGPTITIRSFTNGAAQDDFVQRFNTSVGSVTINVPSNVTKEGFQFKGWSTNNDDIFSYILYLPDRLTDHVFTTSIDLYAAWDVFYYTITYDKGAVDVDGDAPVDVATYASGQTYPISNQGSMIREGYIFNGWVLSLSFPSSTIVAPVFKSTIMNGSNLILYAWWISNTETTYTVTYTNTTLDVQNGPPVDPTLYPSGSTVVVLDQGTMAAEVNGLIFEGWALNGTLQTDTFTITENTTLEALWITEAFTVTYVNNTSNIEAEVPVDVTIYNSVENEVTLQPMATVTTLNYLLTGWSLTSDFSGELLQVGTPFYLSQNVTFYAVWGQGYIVTYISSQLNTTGVPIVTSATYAIDSSIVLSGRGSLSVPNYTFLGWSITDDMTTLLYQEGTEYTVTQNVDFYAVWEEDPKYTVTYVNQFPDTTGDVPVELNTFYAGTTYFVLGRGTMESTIRNVVFRGW